MSTKHKNNKHKLKISKKGERRADYNWFLQIRLLRRPGPTPKWRHSQTEPEPKSKLEFGLGLHRDLEFQQIDQNDCVKIGVSDPNLPTRYREFGFGLKKETSVIQEVMLSTIMDFPASLNAGTFIPKELLEFVDQAINNIGSSVWKSTAEIITYSVDKLFVAAADSSDSNNGMQLSSSSQV